MQSLDRKNVMIVTIVLAVLFGCAGIFTCLGGFVGLTDTFDITSFPYQLWAFVDLGNICSGLAFVALPIAFYFLFLYTPKEKEETSAE